MICPYCSVNPVLRATCGATDCQIKRDRDKAVVRMARLRAARGPLEVARLDRERYRRNPLPFLRKRHVRRSRVRNGRITVRDWEKLKNRYQKVCAYCQAPAPTMTMDHVVPVSKGGAHSIGNIVPSCMPCNSSKGAKLLYEWKVYLRSKSGGSDSEGGTSRN